MYLRISLGARTRTEGTLLAGEGLAQGDQLDGCLGVVVDLHAGCSAGPDTRSRGKGSGAETDLIDVELNHRHLVAGPWFGIHARTANKGHRRFGHDRDRSALLRRLLTCPARL